MQTDERVPRARRGGTLRGAVALAVLLAGAVLARPVPAVADPLPDPNPTVTATVWAHAPTTTEYRITGGYSAHSGDGDVVVRRTGTGAYTVALEGAATSGGVAHAVAYGGGPVLCTVASWYRSPIGTPDLLIQVRCFAATGSPADSRFVATFTNVRQVGQGRLAWFVTDQAQPTGVRTLPAAYRYDSTGGTVAYERLDKGRYRFLMNPNPPSEGGAIFPMAHVTALGGTAVHCQLDPPDGWVVHCANAAGNPVDARFVVTYGSRVDLLGRAFGPRFASGVFHGENVSGTWIGGESYNSTIPGFGGATGTVLGTGRYQARFAGTGTGYGTAFVNSFVTSLQRPPRGYCVLAKWSPSGADTVVSVNCYTWLGVPANLNARISYTTWPAA
ncbi:hypothetical protein ACFHW0_16890 [Micromonospora sp. LOL_025]|uniref:hypothetical protein n=1 Tax=Micromonospora sp. LOL_025 TaxID=3345413 RepID=UPI003A8B8BDB